MSIKDLSRRHLLAAMAVAPAAWMGLAGCSNKSSEAEGSAELGDDKKQGLMEGYAADTQFKAAAPFEVGILWTDWPNLPVKPSWKVFDEIKKRTNVSMKLTHLPFSDHAEKRSLLISAGDAPALIPLVYMGEDKPFVSSGAVLPLSDYMDYFPNFQKYVKEWKLEDVLEQLRQADGKLYMLPGLKEVTVPVFSLVIRQDVFEEVGVPNPQTWDELRTALEKIKAKYPKSKPLADGFEGQSMLNYAAHGFGTVAGWGFGSGMVWNEKDQKLEYAATTEGYKQLVTYFHDLAADGLLDTESFTAANSGTGAADVPEKFSKNLVFAASGAAGTVLEFAQAMDATELKGQYKVIQIAPPGGPAGNLVEPRNFWHGFMLSSKVKDSPNFAATLQFVDWLYYNPEAREMLRWGIKDETYTKDASGKITLKDGYALKAFNFTGGKTDIQTDLGFSTFIAEATESRALMESYNTKEFVQYMDDVLTNRKPKDPTPPAPLLEDELEQASLASTPIKDAVDTNTMKFILGDRKLSEWDAFVKEIEGQGLQQYVDLMNSARERFAKEHG